MGFRIFTEFIISGNQTFHLKYFASSLFLRFNCLLGPFIFTVVSLKKGPTIPIVLHTAWAHALSALVIVCPCDIECMQFR